MEQKNESFQYTYSAKQQEEIKNIRQKYAPKEENKMEQLRRLDKSVTRPGTMAAIVIGVIGTLLFGLGMSCTTVGASQFFIPGIVIGIIGIIGIAAAYPIYVGVTKKQRQKLAPEILRLSEELMK